MKRWVMPVELSRHTLQGILEEVQQFNFAQQVQTEIFSYGHLPLAYSARCFTARNRNLPKDDCQLSCLDYPDGIPVHTRENTSLFTLNGIQTLSGDIHNLLAEYHDMAAIGVDILRISPNSSNTFQVLEQFDQIRRGETVSNQLIASDQGATAFCNGYWYGKPGMDFT